MNIEHLRYEASRAWLEYGKTIGKWFDEDGCNIVAVEPFEKMIEDASESDLLGFIEHTREFIAILKQDLYGYDE